MCHRHPISNNSNGDAPDAMTTATATTAAMGTPAEAEEASEAFELSKEAAEAKAAAESGTGRGSEAAPPRSEAREPPGLVSYGIDYWDPHYLKDPEPYEWLASFADLRGVLEDATDNDKTCRILNIGCGNSLITEDMYDNGYKNIVNIDNSLAVIKQMKERNSGIREGMTWMVGDATNIELKDGSFDLILDKSVLDTLALSDDATTIIAAYLKEVMRVLSDRGVYLCISYDDPETWMSHTESLFSDWHLRITGLQPTEHIEEDVEPHFIYICRKQGTATLKVSVRPPPFQASVDHYERIFETVAADQVENEEGDDDDDAEWIEDDDVGSLVKEAT
eukprot:gnl/MRDRNA2_/MRDRNA2_78526_c0_seq3.p1 gnl/MRDRNA2_/MRDRNA2_78526_c0~~gnl/MRDRNA2_/MRDRNA2_78526_c0_seq3.p1  ORF type:complete len:335 (+),score=81.58 gnl/MRDRNA2_/MRDRNA2_78526_c0_seq3:713-1717(+)